jgi:hypothetical protein
MSILANLQECEVGFALSFFGGPGRSIDAVRFGVMKPEEALTWFSSRSPENLMKTQNHRDNVYEFQTTFGFHRRARM